MIADSAILKTSERKQLQAPSISPVLPPVPTEPKSKILALLDAEDPGLWLLSSVSTAAPSPSSLKDATPHPPNAGSTSLIRHFEPRLQRDRNTLSTPLPLSTTLSLPERSPEPPIMLCNNERQPNSITNTAICHVNGTQHSSATKSIIYSFKQYPPTPSIVYTRDECEADEKVKLLKGPLGFDLEWLVTFRRGKSPIDRRTALVQLCDARMVLLIQVSAMKRFPQQVKAVIEDKNVIKLGANIKNDGQKLFRDFGLLSAGLVELGALARHVDPSCPFPRSITALARVVEQYTGKTLSKGKVRTSDWEAELTQTQINYAANDAHCALVVYNHVMRIAKEQGNEVNVGELSADLAKEYHAKTRPVATSTTTSVASTATPTSPVPTNIVSDSQTTVIATPSSNQPPVQPPARDQATSSSSTASTRSSRLRAMIAEALAEATANASLNASAPTPLTPTLPANYPASFRESNVVYEPPRPQHMRAYRLWHHHDMPLREICGKLRSKENPLAESTVISYVVRALQGDPRLPYSMDRLKALIQMEAGSWQRHRDWVMKQDGYKKT